ncbi:V/A-type H+/Na+-transporting ATPase subunit I [Methylomarinovum tepidoasis]|uniref:V/A-type H+/Na+-transporting ATPase subunit I n=1 Tax=Methylomarinovum tepidoasis TaxID=2840183 RepID=A0AAU9CGV1_9GAMM|nr:ATPase [Methylomarinovum sp. IN45]BCX88566.1 V/A-type H+/Na+-transporting ATPase subunit I [Methylomarinovum sp. IN45]
MSIVALNKVTLLGLSDDKMPLLTDLQAMGCVEIIPLRPGEENGETGHPAPHMAEALQFLRDCPNRRRQVREAADFDPEEVVRRVLEVRRRLHDLETERDDLIKRLQLWEPWGDFEFAPLEEMDGWRLWFYVVPHADLPRIQALPYPQEVVRRDQRFSYVVLIAREAPQMPVPRVRLGNRSRRQLLSRLDEVELAIEDTQAERAWLTRWYELLRRSVARLQDRAALETASARLLENRPVVALQGWMPAERSPDLRSYARKRRLALGLEEPAPDDAPPTLLRNPPWLRVGEDLVNFYMTPGYRTWDPSAVVFFSFAVFFAMILADAGYAALLGLGLWLWWKRLGSSATGRRYRPLGLTIVIFSLAYGVLVGSYFGLSPPPASLPARLHLLDMSDTGLMMAISILIGCLHIVFASTMDALRHPRLVDGLASVGWALVVSGGLVLVLGRGFGLPLPPPLAGVLAAAGLVLVMLYSAPHDPFPGRLLSGLKGLTAVTAAFGDVLSYLRLFALGLASGSLAAQFNQMAHGLIESMPGTGLVIALLVVLLGHGVNLALGLASGLIHGLRLNVIEFFKWGLKEEGRLFQPLKRTET